MERNQDVHCAFEVGDILECIKKGGNNSSSFTFKSAVPGDKDLIVKAIHDKESKFIASALRVDGLPVATVETECGKFLWASKEYYKVVGKLNRSDYPIF